jgi:uncharacterized protein (DUF362 family)
MKASRRQFVAASAAVAGGTSTWALARRTVGADVRRPTSRVLILTASEYSFGLDALLFPAIKEFQLDLRGKSVLLKPNLVENVPGKPVNTHPRLVGAACDCFLRLGAKSVTVAEGPGHERDTELILCETGMGGELRDRSISFVDLNRAELVKVKTKANYSGIGHLWLPKTVLTADLVVSMPKIKTHHWAGVTLSMKNMFGVVPGMKYGWPKNLLHWHGIHESILDICATVPVRFVIADGIEAMEGNGPLQGEIRKLNRIVLADDPVSADATCARLMGLDPRAVTHIQEGSRFLGNADSNRIAMIGETMPKSVEPFSVLPEFRYLLVPIKS